jgi:hypothetical protein
MWTQALRAVTGLLAASSVPWYRRADVWLLLVAIVLPFGWILALARIAWATAVARRARQRVSGAFASGLSRPAGNQGT